MLFENLRQHDHFILNLRYMSMLRSTFVLKTSWTYFGKTANNPLTSKCFFLCDHSYSFGIHKIMEEFERIQMQLKSLWAILEIIVKILYINSLILKLLSGRCLFGDVLDRWRYILDIIQKCPSYSLHSTYLLQFINMGKKKRNRYITSA